MHRTFTNAALTAFTILLAAPLAGQDASDAALDAIDRAARADLAASAATTGVVGGVLYQGEIDFLGAWGVPGPGQTDELVSQYLFAWPAFTEMMLAATVRALHDAGQLNADMRLGQYVNGLPTWLQGATLDQLLTHRAGLSDIAAPAGLTWEGLIDGLPADVRLAPAGSAFSWSRWSYPIAARILERLVGAPVSEIAQFAIIAPLGMSRTSFSRSFAEAGGLAVGQPESSQQPWDLPVVYTTAADVMQFAAAWMGGAIRGVGPAQLDGVHGEDLLGRTFIDGFWLERIEGLRRLSREGADLGFTTSLEMYAEANTALIFWGNGAGPNTVKGAVGRDIYFNLGTLGLRALPGTPAAPLAADWAGTWRNGDRSFTIATANRGPTIDMGSGARALVQQDDGSWLADDGTVVIPRIVGDEPVIYVDARAYLRN